MNPEEFWSLPGPRRFVAAAVSDVLDGKCVVARAPLILLDDLASEIRRHLREREYWFDTLTPSTEPLQALSLALPKQDGPPVLRTIIDACGPTRRIMLVTVTDAKIWPEWASLLLKFHQQIVRLDEHTRPILVITTSCSVRSLCDEVALRIRAWDGAWTETDSIALAQSFSHGLWSDSFVEKVAVHTVASLAIWDTQLCARLTASTKEMFSDPLNLLKEVASSRGWTARSQEDEDMGTAGYLDGRRVMHSALLAVRADDSPQGRHARAELDRRTWKAQAAVLLPWIEEQRLRLVRDIARFLPIRDEDPPEIREIGSIWFELRRTNAPANQKWKVSLLRDARNTLAHRDILSEAQLKMLETTFKY